MCRAFRVPSSVGSLTKCTVAMGAKREVPPCRRDVLARP